MHTLVLLRHGESQWHTSKKFTGWYDCDLTDEGVQAARRAGRALAKRGIAVDLAFTSVLKRSIKTLWTVLDELDRQWVTVHRHWRLNDRHMGGLQGLDMAEATATYGRDQVLMWQTSYDGRPPLLTPSDPRHLGKDPRYKALTSKDGLLGESLQDTINRVIPYWEEVIAPAIGDGASTIVVAHGDSLKAIVKYLDSMSDHDISELVLPAGVPVVYELDEDLEPIRHYTVDTE